MPAPDPGPGTGPESQVSARLLSRARRGEQTAIGLLFERHLKPLQRWAHGRLPRWARTMADTADLVQDALLNTLQRLHHFEPEGQGALRAYLRRAVDNRIKDEYRRIARRGVAQEIDEAIATGEPTPFDAVVERETERRYRRALRELTDSERQLVVAKVELGYSIEQLALMTGRSRPDSARVALRRALVRLADGMRRA